MNFSELFIRRPIATSLLTIALLLAGAIGYAHLPVAPLPRVDFPVISVGAGLPGASPETMASAVATPLERQFGRIAGVNQMTSISQLGSTNITLQFDLDRDINAAARDVQAAINAARSQLPSYLPNNPSYRKVNPADAPILILSLTSDTMQVPQVYDAADSILAQKLSQIDGVGQVFVGGSAAPAVRIEANPVVLNQTGIGLDQIRTAIAAQNVNRPKGELNGGDTSWTITANDQLKTADQYRPIIVAYNKGAPVRLGDVAGVSDSLQDVRNAGTYNGKRAVMVIIFRQPGANIISTVDRVLAELPQLQASVPAAVKINVVLDRTATIRASVHDIQLTLLVTVVLVILVVFVFLRDVRSTLIPGVAVPLAIIGTFAVMYLLDYSIDNLSLMALTVCTGFVIDDAIVVLENIVRHMEAGMKPFPAALLGAREIGFTVVSMSISLIAVFTPILLMAGLVGRLFREFAVVMSTAVALSMVISLTTTPMLCAKFLKPLAGRKHGHVYQATERAFDYIHDAYRRSLRWVLQHEPLALGVTFGVLVLTVVLAFFVPKGFFPQQDTGRLVGSVVAEQDISFQAMNQKMNQFAEIVRQDPAVDGVIAFAGGFAGGSNAGRMFIVLKPMSERKLDSDQVIARLRPKLAKIPGANLFLQAVQELQIGGRQSGAQYQYTLQGDTYAGLVEWAPKLMEKLRSRPELRDVNSDLQNHGLQRDVVIDRDTAARLGVTPQEIDSALYDSFGQRQVSTIYRQLNQYHVVLEIDPAFQQTPDALNITYVRAGNGKQVPLSSFAHYGTTNAPLQVPHQGQFPAITISFNLAPGVSLGQATTVIEQAQREIGLPTTIHGSFQGTAAAFQQSGSSNLWLILAALGAVYIVLGVLYESYIHPFTILSTLPSAGVGALLALILFRLDLDIISLIGIILLIGIVKKNAIMMIDFALQTERQHGKTPEEAIYEAALIRFRPISMTTMAALLGALPLALGTGTGAELRRPLGVAIVGGLIVSQMVTLYTTPVIYVYLDRFQNWIRRRKPRAAAEPLGQTD